MSGSAPALSNPPSYEEIVALCHYLGKEVIAAYAEDVDDKARFPEEAFAAFREHKLLSSYIPTKLGGMGLDMRTICKMCEIFGKYCASTAMIYAMHQIQIACIVHHLDEKGYFEQYLKELVDNQYLLASATTEIGVGGDLTSSKCAVEVEGDSFKLVKQAPVISYAEAADAIFVTCRKSPQSTETDQVQVLVHKDNCQLEALSTWDTLGFRGTCSQGFVLTSSGHPQQIQPTSFNNILAETMHPVAHLVWSSLWLGLSSDAVEKARASVRAAARKTPGHLPISAMRLQEVDEQLYTMRASIELGINEYQELLDKGDSSVFHDYGFSIRSNNIKIVVSEMMIDIVKEALIIVGISGFKNDSSSSLCRHVRDSYGAALMVNNDRIRGHNSTMHIAYKPRD